MTARQSSSDPPEWRRRFERLKEQYPSAGAAGWEAARAYAADFRQALASRSLSDTTVTAGLATDQLWLIEQAHWSTDVQLALNRVGGHIPNGALHYFTSHQLMGWTNAVAGTVFEQTIADVGNAGKIPQLPHGTDHVVLADRTQKAWDLDLMHGHTVVGHAQVKFSDDAWTIVHHLEHNPDVPIVISNHEAAVAALHHGVRVIDARPAYEQLHQHVADQLAAHAGVAHFAHEWLPEASILIILALAAKRLSEGVPRRQVSEWAREQLVLALGANAAGTLVSLGPHGIALRLPTAMLTRFYLLRSPVGERAAQRVEQVRAQLRHMHGKVDQLITEGGPPR